MINLKYIIKLSLSIICLMTSLTDNNEITMKWREIYSTY